MKLCLKKWLKRRNRSFLPPQYRLSFPRSASAWVDVSNFDTRVPASMWFDVVAVMRPLVRDYQNGHFDPGPEGCYVTTDSLPSGVSE